MIETTADARRRGLYNPDYHINENNRHLFPPIQESGIAKECRLKIIYLEKLSKNKHILTFFY